jgi:hypothetical protein
MRGWPKAVAVVAAAGAAIAMPAVTLSARVADDGYVTSTLALPANSTQAKAFGRDIDRDGHPDNALGAFFAALAGNGLDLAGATQADVTEGNLLMLHSLRTPSFKKTKKATWQVFYAQQTQSPDFSGAGSFTVDTSAPHSARLATRIAKHHVRTATGAIPVQLDLGGGVFTLHLKDAQILATCARAGCSHGRITGVIGNSDITGALLPELATQFTAIVARDCPGSDSSSCADNSDGKTIESLFDTNNDLVITADELQQNGLVQAILAPDIDTNHDGNPDALSVGIGFGTVKARIKH